MDRTIVRARGRWRKGADALEVEAVTFQEPAPAPAAVQS